MIDVPPPSRAVSRRQWLATFAALGLGNLVHAQGPERTGRIVTGFPPGAGSDAIARMLAEKMRGKYMANLIVENKPGAGGRLAIDTVRNAPSDGATILLSPASPITLFPSIYKKLSYDVQKDLIPVGTVFSTQMGLVVGPRVPAKSVAEYLLWVKQNPNEGSYGSLGTGTTLHFLGAMFQRETHAELQHVPYKGAAPVWVDLLGGQIPAAFVPIGFDAVERHKIGKARILAVAASARMKNLPDVPTFTELGYKSLLVEEWFGLFLPTKTPVDHVSALRAALDVALKEPDLIALLERNQTEPMRSTSAELAARIQSETQAWRGIVRATGFTPED
jgi:tripartite-type tricarboxylate transporter receptor subunit TctC